VQDGEEADGGAQMTRIGGDDAQRVRGRVEEDAVDHRFVLRRDLGDGLGHGEDDVKVLAVEQIRGPVFDPRGAGQRLAAGAMPVSAAVVPHASVPAVVALLDMAAEGSGAARLEGGHDAPLGRRQDALGRDAVGVPVAADDVPHRERRAIHARGSDGDGGRRRRDVRGARPRQ
jgi:hypothetical protein